MAIIRRASKQVYHTSDDGDLNSKREGLKVDIQKACVLLKERNDVELAVQKDGSEVGFEIIKTSGMPVRYYL